MRIKRNEIISLPKSLYFCLKSMPFSQAIHIPILVSWRTVLKSVAGQVEITGEKELSYGMIRIGFGGSGTAMHLPCCIENNGVIRLARGVQFGGGSQICTVDRDSVLSVGKNTSIVGECHIVAKKNIRIGPRCQISWNTQLMDTDLHKLLSDNTLINEDQNIEIGSHVWICSKAVILKGASICSNTVIAAGAVISGSVTQERQVVTGMPLTVLRRNCDWQS